MATTKRPKKAPAPEDVDAFITGLRHPKEAEIRAIRKLILGADRSVEEGLKWNAPSFRTTEWFATFHLRAKEGVQVIFHLGAKKRRGAKVVVADPKALLEWLGDDRASIKFRDLAEIKAKGLAFTEVTRAWIEFV